MRRTGTSLLVASGVVGLSVFTYAISSMLRSDPPQSDMWQVAVVFFYGPPALLACLLFLVGVALRGIRGRKALLLGLAGCVFALATVPASILVGERRARDYWDSVVAATDKSFEIDDTVRGYDVVVVSGATGIETIPGTDLSVVQLLLADYEPPFAPSDDDFLSIDLRSASRVRAIESLSRSEAIPATLTLDGEAVARVEVRGYEDLGDPRGGEATIEYTGVDARRIYDRLKQPRH